MPSRSGAAERGDRRAGLRRVVVLGCISLVSGLTGALLVDTGAVGAVLQRLGIAMPVYVKSSGNLTERGSHVRIIGDDGNFEFEHAATEPFARLNSYVTGTGTRTPIAIGFPDGRDIVELLVRGSEHRKADLEEWVAGSRVVAAIDGQGHLRLGNATLSVVTRNGHAVLVATVGSGKPQVIAGG